ncbi:Exostosin, GT47 domain, partial [Dillenia turbinata]
MSSTSKHQRLCHVDIRRLLVIIGITIAIGILSQFFALLSGNYTFALPLSNKVSKFIVVNNATLVHGNTPNELPNMRLAYNQEGFVYESSLDVDIDVDGEVVEGKNLLTEVISEKRLETSDENLEVTNFAGVTNSVSELLMRSKIANRSKDVVDTSSVRGIKQVIVGMSKDEKNELLQSSLGFADDISSASSDFNINIRQKPLSISAMNLLLHQHFASSSAVKPRLSSARDRELLSSKMLIQNAPVLRHSSELHASLFRNVSIFKRSYELMERMLKIYVYKEGEKPIFHQPKLRGIYSSEGWFMKLLERNKQFTVRDPKKAHLFYLPFSLAILRSVLSEQNSTTMKDVEKYLTDYMDLIARKYRFWKRASGADHFLVACHDWALRVTRNRMANCIRVLCNSNIARGFQIGKDTALPVTYIRSSENPLRDIGGKPPRARHILAFFAGGMHGYLRPILLKYWENKEPDMKIFGPMPRDIEGKMVYREYMKSSKYCICAKGYEVHTPRVVEAIFYECVPVIISDNYVLDWEAFAVFVLEKDIPNLRNILLSIPEKKFLEMQSRVKLVQQHFLWHKSPVKYDLFHMVLHSIWYNRVFQSRGRMMFLCRLNCGEDIVLQNEDLYLTNFVFSDAQAVIQGENCKFE